MRAGICAVQFMEMDPEADTGWPVNCNVDSNDGYKNVGRLGIAFFQKKCLVKKM